MFPQAFGKSFFPRCEMILGSSLFFLLLPPVTVYISRVSIYLHSPSQKANLHCYFRLW